MILIFLSQT